MDAPALSTHHFERMAWLTHELAADRIDLLEHQYAPATFGSFVIALAKGHDELRFTWDGRDSVLAVGFRKRGAREWTHDAYISVPDQEGLYAEIASQATTMLAV